MYQYLDGCFRCDSGGALVLFGICNGGGLRLCCFLTLGKLDETEGILDFGLFEC